MIKNLHRRETGFALPAMKETKKLKRCILWEVNMLIVALNKGKVLELEVNGEKFSIRLAANEKKTMVALELSPYIKITHLATDEEPNYNDERFNT